MPDTQLIEELEQLRAESERLQTELEKESHIADDYACEADNFRSRAVELCNQKAVEYEESAEQFKHDDRLRLCLSSKREAYKAMAVELGKLT